MKVYITKHALNRFRQRAEMYNTSNEDLQKKIKNLVLSSRLYSLQENNKELRLKNGFVFVCKYESKTLTVLTVLLSKTKITFSDSEIIKVV